MKYSSLRKTNNNPPPTTNQIITLKHPGLFFKAERTPANFLISILLKAQVCQERISAFLLPYAGYSTMSGEQASIVWQAQDLGLYTLEKLMVAATGQVRASDAPSENRIAAEQGFFRWRIEYDMPRGMSGNMPHLKLQTANMQFLTGSKLNGWAWTVIHFEAK